MRVTEGASHEERLRLMDEISDDPTVSFVTGSDPALASMNEP